MQRRAIIVMVATIGILLAAPFVWGKLLKPGSPVMTDWNTLFMQVFIIAMIVAALVWALLLYALVRFRQREGGPKEGPHIHGNTKLEIAWTLAPTLVFAWLLVLSFNGIFAIEEHPDNPTDFTVDVEASQFLWTFTYPDGEISRGTLRVEQNAVVEVKVTSVDVIHAFGVAELGVMIDAVPGRTNTFWFQADQPGEYEVKCREMCGVGHSRMRAVVEVFPEGEQGEKMWGDPAEPEPTETTSPTPTTNATTTPTGNETTTPVEGQELLVQMGNFFFDPDDIDVQPGETYTFILENVDPATPHNLNIGPQFDERDWESDTASGGETVRLTVTFPDEDVLFEIWCNVPGHYQAGMRGTLAVGEPAGEVPTGEEPLLPGFEVAALLAGLVVAVAALRRRR